LREIVVVTSTFREKFTMAGAFREMSLIVAILCLIAANYSARSTLSVRICIVSLNFITQDQCYINKRIL